MGYDRSYRLEEVHQMLYLSERRPRPTGSHPGHAISRHTEQREDPFDRRRIAQDSTFASRKDLVLAVHEALNDPGGQSELAKLNARDEATCRIVVNLTVNLGKIRANVVRNPMAQGTRRLEPAQGPQQYLTQQLASSVFVLADKLLPAESWAPLHIQTAYPSDIIE